MIVTAALAWFDEPLEDLERCVRSLPVIADRLVAVDGGYQRFPGAAPSSGREQADLIRRTARDVGLDVQVVVPRKVWAGQCEKRTHLLGLAAEGSDWIAGVDADHVFHGDRHNARWELAKIDRDELGCDAVDVNYWTPMNHDRPLVESAAGDWHAGLAGDVAVITAIFRAFPGYRVEKHHWWYSAIKNGDRHWVWAGDNRYPHVSVHALHAGPHHGVDPRFWVEHRCLFRQEKQILANRQFCKDRVRVMREFGQEDPVAREPVAA